MSYRNKKGGYHLTVTAAFGLGFALSIKERAGCDTARNGASAHIYR
jgi:hypothetical protein